MIRLFRFFFSIAVLFVLLLVADRFAARVAGQVVADRIKASQHLATTPSVSIKGFPFLTQLVEGHYDHVDASAVNLNHGGVRASALTLHLYGVHVGVTDVLNQSVKTIPVDHANGDVVLSWADINVLAKPDGVTVKAGEKGVVTVSGSVVVGGQRYKGSGTGSVTATPDGLRITLSDLRTTGLTAAVTALLRTKLSFVIPNSSLPYGIKVQSVDQTPTGVRVAALAGAFVIPVG